MIRRVTLGLLVATIALPAWAGGSWIDPYRESYEAGDTVTMRGSVSPGQLGWVEDGPFYAYLRVNPQAVENDPEHPETWPNIHETDLALGELRVATRSDGWVDASITFVLPDELADGEYWVVYCNEPCTTGIGDLIGGVLYVGTTAEEVHGPPEDEHDHPETTTTVEVTVVTEAESRSQADVLSIQTSTETRDADFDSATNTWLWPGLGLIAVAVVGVVLARLYVRR